MKRGMLVLMVVVGVMGLQNGLMAQSWPNLPSWYTPVNDSDFTMSVALADLDNDGFIDLIEGNYKYPYNYTPGTPPNSEADLQMSDIGAKIKAHQGNSSGLSDVITEFNIASHCIDCIAIADYDCDNDLDIAVGTVVGKGNDGGVYVFRNQLSGGDTTFSDLFLDNGTDSTRWHPDSSYDCHCVRWVDFDCDGDLDLATLEVGGTLRIYPMSVTTVSEDSIVCSFDNTPIPFSLQDETDDLNYDALEYPIGGTTMEFGDMDKDGDPDVFVNIGAFPRVYRNRLNEGITDPSQYYSSFVYWTVNPTDWSSFTTKKENSSCASFGFYHGDTTKLALAIGSRDYADGGTPNYFGGWRNDIYTLYKTGQNPDNWHLDHAWQSGESMSGNYLTQSVTDIRWAKISGNESYMDLVACSYPVYKATGSPNWTRGKELYYQNPYVSEDPWSTQLPTWQSETNDLSTSLALGDVGYDYTQVGSVSQDFTNDTLTTQVSGLFYLNNFPYYGVTGVQVYNRHTHQWVQFSRDLWCNDAVNGWVSISRDTLRYQYYLGQTIRISYKPFLHQDLAIGNDGRNVVYLQYGTGSSLSKHLTHEITVNDPSTPIEYDPAAYGINPSSTTVDLMAKDAVGGGFSWPLGIYNTTPDQIDPAISNCASLKRLLLPFSWVHETFQGHYYWDRLDQNINEIHTMASSDSVQIFTYNGPLVWTTGDRLPLGSHGDTFVRTSDERLHTMFVRNLVNRYRPHGLLEEQLGFNWDDWGVTFFQFDNEPDNNVEYNYWGDYPDSSDEAIRDLAERMYREYQMIKTIQNSPLCGHRLSVISPNWAVHDPYVFRPDQQGTNDRLKEMPMPYLNALNKVNLPFIPNSGSYDRVLWRFTDYICQQMYNYKITSGGLEKVDPFTQDFADPDSLKLKLGIEQLFWGYYTEGLGAYLYPNYPPYQADWTPVMKMPNATNPPYSEHPFMVIEWVYADQNQVAVNNLEDYCSAQLAEEFSVDVFPAGPNEAKDHRLLTNDVSCEFFRDDTPNAVYNTVAGLLNDPTGSGNRYNYGLELIKDNGTVKVHSHVYRPKTGFPLQNNTYFLRTDYGPNSPTDQFVKNLWVYTMYDSLPQGCSDNPTETSYKLDCYTPTGSVFQKNFLNGCVPCHFSQSSTNFQPGEMGPAMQILHPSTNQPENTNDQSLSLHKGWNLVSWQLDIEDPDPGDPFYLGEVVESATDPDFPDNFSATPPYDQNRIYWYNQGQNYYYPQNDPTWDSTQAYYINIMNPYENPANALHLNWGIVNQPQLVLSEFWFTPNNAWNQTENLRYQNASYWYFMPFTAPGYCKLASIPAISPLPSSGDPDYYWYEGPFHWLIWKDSRIPGNPENFPPWDLKIVKTDDGRYYIPSRNLDKIGTLEPGRGYFLGFLNAGYYPFEGWENWSQWRNENYVPPDNKESQQGICSGTHFQYHPYTHWSYPVVIDSIDQNQVPLAVGDEIGIFDGEMCVGAERFEGEFPLGITTWQDDIATPDTVDGYNPGNEMTFIWYDASENTEAEFVPPPSTQAADDPISPSHSGFGVGFYAQRSFLNGVQSVLQLPTKFALKQNFPNPFNAETVIPIELPQRSKVKVEIYNLRGQKICTAFNGTKNAGWEQVRYNAVNLASGIYFCRVTAEGLEREGKFSSVSKLVVLK